MEVEHSHKSDYIHIFHAPVRLILFLYRLTLREKDVKARWRLVVETAPLSPDVIAGSISQVANRDT